MFKNKLIDQLKQKFKNGGIPLKGGAMIPIPGTDSVQFKGNTHEEGGIMYDHKTEVEHDEVMTKVNMKKGGAKDYFFSSYLKKGGMSFADMSKDILQNGGSQKEINTLARMQEKAAKRDPNKIQSAKLGGVMQYKTGGPFKNKEEGNAFRAWVNETYPDYAEEIDLDNTGGYDNDYIMKAWAKHGESYTNKDVAPPELIDNDSDEISDGIDIDGGTGTDKPLENVVGGDETFEGPFATDQQINDGQFQGERDSLYAKLRKRAEGVSDTPAVALGAGLAQLGPAAYSLFHKQPDAEQAKYTRGFTSPIVAEMAKAPKLERVNYNAEKASNASQMREISKYIETSGGGPANIINKMAAYGKKQEGNMMIAAAESKANIGIANQEASMKNQVSLNNLQRAQQASQLNAQLQQSETARMDQINLANAAARQAVKDDEEFQKYQGVNTLGSNIAGLAGDYLSYKASERMARVMGSEGIYDRDAFRTIATKELKKTGVPGICGGDTGIPCTDDHINKFITSQNK